MRSLTVLGRVRSVRKGGSKLLFVDLVQDNRSVQGIINVEGLEEHDPLEHRNIRQYLQRGDIICKYLLLFVSMENIELHS